MSQPSDSLFSATGERPNFAGAQKGRTMSELTKALTDSTFDEEIGSAEEPVLVDFWAEWCGPCKLIEPVLEEIAEENKGRLRVSKVNVDDNLDIVRRFDVMSIPTLILFKDGEPRVRLVGAKGKAQLLQEIGRHLS
jgi:thioredoxin 1